MLNNNNKFHWIIFLSLPWLGLLPAKSFGEDDRAQARELLLEAELIVIEAQKIADRIIAKAKQESFKLT